MLKKKNSEKKLYFFLFLSIVSIYSCKIFTPSIANFDQYAYSQTTSLKVDALNLMDSATSDYQSHIKSIISVKVSFQKLYEYEKNLPKNEITLKQWQILTDTTGHLFGGFMARWRNEKKLKRAFVDDEKELVSNAFDQIAGLESKKIKSLTK